ncbi:MAG: cytochrome c-type biogenesis protein CcmH [Gammaproteobacteria bacterium]|nr:cytochrome c-type biogenesis protein CcmH [Gammaproteobacteria bacterium]
MNRLNTAMAALCLSFCTAATAAFSDTALEARFKTLTSELRCLVCQNQTIADSNAALAIDLRNEVERMLQAGATDSAIVDYMVARYGDFVLYRPPVKSTTLLLWAAPALFLGVGLGGWLWLVRASRRTVTQELTAEEQTRAQSLLRERAQLHTEGHRA